MTGHAPFARTLRALDADSFRMSKLAFLVAALVLVAWVWWFFTPSIPADALNSRVSRAGVETRCISPATAVLRALHE